MPTGRVPFLPLLSLTRKGVACPGLGGQGSSFLECPHLCQEGSDPGSLKTYPGRRPESAGNSTRARGKGWGWLQAWATHRPPLPPPSLRRGTPCQLHPDCVPRAGGSCSLCTHRPALRCASLFPSPPGAGGTPGDFLGSQTPGGSALLLPCVPPPRAQSWNPSSPQGWGEYATRSALLQVTYF